MSILQAANVNVTSTLSVGALTSNQSTVTVGNNVINSSSISSNITNTNILAVDQIQPKGANVTIIVPSAYSIYSPGSVVQVINTYLTAPVSQSISAGYTTYNDLSGFSASITPKSSNSKIYMTVRWFGEYGGSAAYGYDTMWNIKRNGVLIGQPSQPGSLIIGIHMTALSNWGADADSTSETTFFDYYDSPGTVSPLTYQVTISTSASYTLYTNRCVNGATTGGYERGTTSITLFEIAG